MKCKNIVKKFGAYTMIACVTYDKLFLYDRDGNFHCLELDENLKFAESEHLLSAREKIEDSLSASIKFTDMREYVDNLYKIIDEYIAEKYSQLDEYVINDPYVEYYFKRILHM